MTENTTPTLLEAARALAMARERVAYLRDARPDTLVAARQNAEDRKQAYAATKEAEAALDAAYRAEEYGDES